MTDRNQKGLKAWLPPEGTPHIYAESNLRRIAMSPPVFIGIDLARPGSDTIVVGHFIGDRFVVKKPFYTRRRVAIARARFKARLRIRGGY